MMERIPSHIEQAIRDLAREGLPVAQIAFMTRVGPKLVEEILAAPPKPDEAQPTKPPKPSASR